MSLEQVYQWCGTLREHLPNLGHWQALNLAVYSLGMVLARHSAPRRVAEKCGVLGKPDSVQRHLERFLDNGAVCWWTGCRYWATWVLSRYGGERISLLVDETKLGHHLSIMVIGLAYRSCCIPLAFWCYRPDAWPDRQVNGIDEWLCWVVESLPEGGIPLVQADRGIGTSPDVVRSVCALGWHFLFRVQGQTKFRANGQERSLRHLVNAPGQHWSATGPVFKKAGWLPATVPVIWAVGYRDPWCLITNCPRTDDGWLYAQRYWQEAGFRDLKSDGWQWHTSRIWSPDHANRLMLVMALATAWTLTLGSFVFDDPALKAHFTKGQDPTFSLFRLGLRFVEGLLDHSAPSILPLRPFVFLPEPLPDPISVGV